MAYQALKGGSSQQPEVPAGLLEPQSAAERQQLEQHSEIMLKAMINAAKADGQIDQGEWTPRQRRNISTNWRPGWILNSK